MDAPLQNWCQQSLQQIASHISAGPHLQSHAAEQWLEFAAFARLADVHGLQAAHVGGNRREWPPVPRHVMSELIKTSPLTVDSPPSVLGQIHELLVTWRSTGSRHRTSIGDARKVLGIFYTPTEVIDYIVTGAVDQGLTGWSPESTSPLTILDPAVGGGAFMLAAFQLLKQRYCDWYVAHGPQNWSDDIIHVEGNWTLTRERALRIVRDHLFGVDLDAAAVEAARRSLLLTVCHHAPSVDARWLKTAYRQIAQNVKHGHALIGSPFVATTTPFDHTAERMAFDWTREFPQVARRGGFDVIVGNPPYRRERGFQQELQGIAQTALGRFRVPRMDLWYYFVHRAIELLRPHGRFSFITNAYWLKSVGARKLIADLQQQTHVEEIFLLGGHSVFSDVSGQHVIFRACKTTVSDRTAIKELLVAAASAPAPSTLNLQTGRVRFKRSHELFDNGMIDLSPSPQRQGVRWEQFATLADLGEIRQGIAENPATLNRRTMERFPREAEQYQWQLNEGVFALRPAEVDALAQSAAERQILRPYHDLCDLGRYWAAARPSRELIYATRETCPNPSQFPHIARHLARFKIITSGRRETREGRLGWWQLHWPREERIWYASKLLILQMASRPSTVATFGAVYVPFSVNVFVPAPETREDLRYFSALMNSTLLKGWFENTAKRRGAGVELNGHVLRRVPVRRIDFEQPSDVTAHDHLVQLVQQRMDHERKRRGGEDVDSGEVGRLEVEIDAIVDSLYRLRNSARTR